uniref:MARVEL domain-containing protein n=1 Tax=Ciona savignyi TaxID=51511 RepID=H2Y9E3_CIOSA
MKLKVDSTFLSSGCGVLQAFCLFTGGGVFGTIAQTDAIASSTVAHALLWISVSAWVVSMVGYLSRAFGKRFYDDHAASVFGLIFSIFYLIGTICFGVYNTWAAGAKGSQNSRSLFIFLLALLTTVGYILEAIGNFMTGVSNDKSCSKAPSPSKAENGKAEEQKKVEE